MSGNIRLTKFALTGVSSMLRLEVQAPCLPSIVISVREKSGSRLQKTIQVSCIDVMSSSSFGDGTTGLKAS